MMLDPLDLLFVFVGFSLLFFFVLFFFFFSYMFIFFFFFSSRRRHTRWPRDWSSDVCSSDLSKTSIGLAADMAERMRKRSGGQFCRTIPDGQTAGDLFTRLTLDFLHAAFARLQHIRPGQWAFSVGQKPGIAGFYQYEHLADLQEVLKIHKDLKAAL